jgi:hypothetical protein
VIFLHAGKLYLMILAAIALALPLGAAPKCRGAALTAMAGKTSAIVTWVRKRNFTDFLHLRLKKSQGAAKHLAMLPFKHTFSPPSTSAV